MWITVWAWVVVWACSEPAASAYVTKKLRVGVNATFCEHMGSTLLCDYKTTDKMVYMDEELDSSVQKVFVYNAVKLQLSEAVCVSVMFNNVADVVVEGEGDSCEPHFELSARHSTLDRLPSQVSRIYLEDSTITTLSTTVNISQLNVINSVIKVFDISSPLQPGVSVDLVSTTIETLQNLHVTKGSDFRMHKSAVAVVAYHGLINEGNVVLRESTTSASEEDSVIMLPGATLTLNSYSGSLRIKATSLNSYGERDHMTQSPSETCVCDPITSYFRAFVACLILLLLACLVIIFCLIYIYMFQVTKSDSDSELPLIGGAFCTASTQVTPEDISSQTLANISEKWLKKLDSLNMEILASLNKEQSDYREKIEAFYKNRKTNIKEIGEPERDKKDKKDENIKPDKKQIAERIKEAEKDLKSAKEDLDKFEKQTHKNTENIELRRNRDQYMDEHVQQMCNIAGQVLNLWKRSLKSDRSSLFIFELSTWLSLCQNLIKEQENKWKVYIKKQNDKYKESSKVLNEKFAMELKELNDNYEREANNIKCQFKAPKWKREMNKFRKLNENENETRQVSRTLLLKKTLNIVQEKLQDSLDDALTAATDNFTREMQRLLEAMLKMHQLCVLFTRQEMNKMSDETTEAVDSQSCTSKQPVMYEQEMPATVTEPVVNDADHCILL